jgi:glutamate synthase (NADPH/NADH) small chain
MIYRRGPEQMSAFAFEYEHAKQEGVRFLWHVGVLGFVGTEFTLVRLQTTADGSLVNIPGEDFVFPAELVILAIGQGTHTEFLADSTGTGKVKLERGRILIDRATGQTSNPKYFAGGDCTNGGREVVDAVADGKRAGVAMAAWLAGGSSSAKGGKKSANA